MAARTTYTFVIPKSTYLNMTTFLSSRSSYPNACRLSLFGYFTKTSNLKRIKLSSCFLPASLLACTKNKRANNLTPEINITPYVS